ncbi:MAG: type III polyketide synthase [Rhodospirillales bacterium]|nr:type III polyketide synthase [Rhodospirillales bacterium]
MSRQQSAPPLPRLLALATAVPDVTLRQDDVVRHAAEIFAPAEGGFYRLAPVYRNARIAQRRSCVPIEWFLEEHGFAERNALFLEHATRLLVEAARGALAQARLAPEDIDVIVAVSSSGIATPGLGAMLMETIPFRDDVQRLPIFGLGCAGGVLGLARAAAMAQAMPDARVLLLVVELCSLTFRRNDRSKSNIVATALFGDGAAAAVVSCRDDGAGARNAPRLGPWGEHRWPNSLDVMGWDVADDGLKVVFSRDIPTLVETELRPVVDAFLARHALTLAEIDAFVPHPGGAKVLDALEDCFGLRRGGLTHARQVLRDFGNMSAVTVLFVLRAALDASPSGRHLLTTLGPGFTAGMMIVEVP